MKICKKIILNLNSSTAKYSNHAIRRKSNYLIECFRVNERSIPIGRNCFIKVTYEIVYTIIRIA